MLDWKAGLDERECCSERVGTESPCLLGGKQFYGAGRGNRTLN